MPPLLNLVAYILMFAFLFRVVLISALKELYNWINLTLNGLKTIAEIKEVKISSRNDTRVFLPTYEYYDTKGNIHYFTPDTPSSYNYETGQIIEILYKLNSKKVFENSFRNKIKIIVEIFSEFFA